jgi:GNAT superfamily N-acetyltransferase
VRSRSTEPPSSLAYTPTSETLYLYRRRLPRHRLSLEVVDLRNYAVKETLEEGAEVTIRAIRREDQDAIREIFENLDEESTYRRFFGPKKELTDAELAYFTDVDFSRVVALVATVPTGTGQALIAGGRFAADGLASPESAELAFTTEKGYRGRGLAHLLLRHLVGIAKELGLSRFEGEVLAENQPMLAVLRRSGLPMQQHQEGNIIHVTLSLDAEPSQPL